MKKAFLISLIAFVYIFTSVYLFRVHHLKSQTEYVKNFYGKYVEDFAKKLSVGYFQWNTMYECVVNGKETELRKWLNQLKRDFPQVESVELVELPHQDFEFFEISSSGKKLRVFFKVYNDDLSEHVPDAGFSVILDAQGFLEEMGVGFLKLVENGEDFAFGLKCERVEPIMNGTSLAVVLVGTFVVYSFVSFVERQKSLLSDLEKEARVSKTLRAVLEVLEHYLKGTKVDELYQFALEKAMKTIPGAQAGSVVVKRRDSYVFATVAGYDEEMLSKAKFSPENVVRWVSGDGKGVSRMLKKVGGLGVGKSNISFAVEVDGEVAVILNLDNFEKEDAFDEEAIETARVFASYLGVLFSKAKFEEELEYLSNHDPLTGLPNRRILEEYGEKLLSIAKREKKDVAVMFIDLGDFKGINDTYGHHFGDEVLKNVAKKLKEAVRQGDLVARFGGDEFVVIAYDCSQDDAKRLAWRIVETLSGEVNVKGQVVRVFAHVGVAIFPRDGVELGQLLRLADMAMYRAKNENEGILFYSGES